jgi:hypothetical protein
MSNNIIPVNFGKATAIARMITQKAVKVLAGPAGRGPCNDGKNIYIGSAAKWDPTDRFAVLLHECCHVLFPAKYPGGNLREISNLIDDCRIERQFLSTRPDYVDSLAQLAINVIAKGVYDADSATKDRWSMEHFDPCLWALLFFRAHLDKETRVAAHKAIRAYALHKGLAIDGNPKTPWETDFNTLVADGLRLTRKATVSTETLTKWGELYFRVFPEAARDLNKIIQVMILNDAPAPKGEQKDTDGAGDEGEDGQILILCAGNAGKGDDKGDGEASSADDLQQSLDELLEGLEEVGAAGKRAAKEDPGTDGEQITGDGQPEESEEEEGQPTTGPGYGVDYIASNQTKTCVDRDLCQRIKTSICKLRQLTIDLTNQHLKRGRLHLPTVIAAERRGILARRPFVRDIDDTVERPVSCVVATDFSSSTSGMNASLNNFAHNALFALQASGCECAEVVWNSGSEITKTIDQTISPLSFKAHESDGGTCLVAATKGCIEALKASRAERRVAFIFTDGAVNGNEVPLAAKHLADNGFEACLLVSLGEVVQASGIISTEVCNDVKQLGSIFEKFVRQQGIKAAQKAIQ